MSECKSDWRDMFWLLLILFLLMMKGDVIHAKVRLGGIAPSSNQGRVEIKYNGTWGIICGINWDLSDAHVVCRMLGYPRALLAKTGTEYGQASNPFVLDSVSCKGDEARLSDCRHGGWGNGRCKDLNKVAGVVCDTGNASNIQVRLRGGLFAHEGRLEVYYSGIWGTVCDDYWDKKDADVVCRMLGFSRANNFTTSAIFPVGNGPIMLARVQCKGDEPSISSCAYDGWIISYCLRKEDVGVICDTGIFKLTDRQPQENQTGRCIRSPSLKPSSFPCVPYGISNERCRDYVYDTFAGVTPTEYWKHSALIRRIGEGFDVMYHANQPASKKCRKMIYDVYCHHYYPSCDVTTNIVLKQQICQESCFMLLKHCKTAIENGQSVRDTPFVLKNCSSLPQRSAGDSPSCYLIEEVNSELDKMQAFSCYYGNGLGYIGTVNVTRSGKTCQLWSSQCPHRHIHKPTKSKYKELMNASNWCRNPEGEGPDGPWCYTTDFSTRWEYCDIPKCPNPGPTLAPVLNKAKALNETAILLAWTPVPEDFLHAPLQGHIIYYWRSDELNKYPPNTIQIFSNDTLQNYTTVTGLQPLSNYSFNVSAFTEYRKGPSSNVLTVQTPAMFLDNIDSQEESSARLRTVLLVTAFTVVFAVSALVFVIVKCWRARQQDEISPYASVNVNIWLTKDAEDPKNVHQAFSEKKRGSIQVGFSSTEDVPQLYRNLDNEGKPLAGELAGTFELKRFYINLNKRYHNVDFRGLPLGGEFRLLAHLSGGTEEAGYNRLFKKNRIRRNSFGGVTEDGLPVYDRLVRRYPNRKCLLFQLRRRSFHDFGGLRIPRKQALSRLSVKARRNSIH